MGTKLGIVMDPISDINIKKDSTFAMLLEAQRRGHDLHYFERPDLFVRDGVALGHCRSLQVEDNPGGWFEISNRRTVELGSLDVILMRKDPPFDMEFVYDTYVLERAELAGALVVNPPQSLRDANEKMFTSWFPQCCVPTLISRSHADLRDFVQEQGQAIIKPLDGMGGTSIFKTFADDPNLNVIVETVSDQGTQLIMAQKFIPEISDGDKRILLVDGEPVPFGLARMAAADDFRGNLAKGGHGVGKPLTERDFWLCEQIGPELKRRGMLFVGLDVIGDYVTEINVTSPTCIRELDAQFDLNIAGQLFDAIEAKLN